MLTQFAAVWISTQNLEVTDYYPANHYTYQQNCTFIDIVSRIFILRKQNVVA